MYQDENGKWHCDPCEGAATEEMLVNALVMMDWWLDESGEWRSPEDIPNHDGATAVPPRRHVPGMVDRCRQYVAKIPSAVSGDNGHDDTFRVAQAVVRGFSLTGDDAFTVLSEYSQRCQPPWSDAELRHKIEDAEKNSHLPWGYIANRSDNPYANGSSNGNQYSRTHTNGKSTASFADEIIGAAEESKPGEPEEFPLECFPQPLADYAFEVAESLSCPIDFVGVAMLGVAASAIGTSRAFAVTRRWLECPRLYLAIVADPGDAKSPALDMVCDPILRRQAVLAREWEQQNEEYEKQKVEYEGKRKQVVNGKAHKSILSDRPKRPPFTHLYTTNSTTEALAAMLKDSPKGFMLYQDEVTAWVMGMNQYKGGKGNDRQFWLSVWSGQKSKVDRKSQIESGPLMINHPFINVLGGIQPDMLSELCDEKARQDGFIHRILFSNPTPCPWSEEIGQPPSEESERQWADVIQTLLAMQMTVNDSNEPVPVILKATHGGREVIAEWYRAHSQERNEPDFPPSLAGPWSKMRSHFFRLACTIHLLRHACDKSIPEQHVDATSMTAAGNMAEYFKSHIRRVYGLLTTTPADKRISDIVHWIRTKPENPGTCTAREVMRKRFVKTASSVESLFRELSDRGYGKVNESKDSLNRTHSVFALYERSDG